MPGPVGERGAQPFGRRSVGGVADAMFAPYVVHRGGVPPGEHAHAVRAGEDVVEVGEQPVPRHAFVDPLRDLVRRLDGQAYVGDDAEGAERDDRTGELVGVAVAGHRDDLTVSRDHLDAGDRGSQTAVAIARSVRTRGY